MRIGKLQKDLTGIRFGRLVVVRIAEGDEIIRKSPGRYWYCVCDCGNTKFVRGCFLRSGKCSSCGCFKLENQRKKGRWKKRENICQTCGIKFEYSAPVAPKTCSATCHRKFSSSYVKNHRNLTIENKIAAITRGARSRAKKNGVFYNITSKYMIELLSRQRGLCAKTGIKLELSDDPTNCGIKSPWGPSIDQIIPSGGYVVGNVQIVCVMYNFSKGAWGDDDVLFMAKKLVENSDKDYE